MIRTVLVSAALLAAASPAFAQGGDLPDPNDRSNTYTIAAGVASIPDYEGSGHNKMTGLAAVRGRVAGMDFWTNATWAYLDVMGRPDSGIDWDAGPIMGVRMYRTGHVHDDQVDDLPNLDTAFELGAFGGASFHGLTNPYDTLSVRLDVLHDFGNAHESTLFTPSISFATPLSRHTYISTSASAEWAGGGYADYYFSISPEDFIDTGLPVYNADGGFKNWQLSLTGLQMITGDLTGGIGVFAYTSYKKLAGDFKDSPVVDIAGDSGQWYGALGLTYTW